MRNRTPHAAPTSALTPEHSDLPESVRQWLSHLQTHRRYSPHTLSGYARDLRQLCAIHPNVALQHVTEAHIRQAVAHLHRQGQQPRSLARALAAWRGFFQWWARTAGLTNNPAASVRAPKAPRSLPKALSVDMAMALLERPAAALSQDPRQLRDQAMFEVLYSSGLRLAELVSLDWRYVQHDAYVSHSWLQLDAADATVQGKGGKTRTVPLGKPAVLALRRWLNVRAQWLRDNDPDAQAALFLGTRGKRITPRVVRQQLQRFAQQVGLPVNVHPHMLRHSFASHLLQSAQDLRAVQELLGHANISSTQIYTRLDFQHLAKVYDQTHPRAHRNICGGMDRCPFLFSPAKRIRLPNNVKMRTILIRALGFVGRRFDRLLVHAATVSAFLGLCPVRVLYFRRRGARRSDCVARCRRAHGHVDATRTAYRVGAGAPFFCAGLAASRSRLYLSGLVERI